MKLNRTDAFWDRKTRNDINENWEILEELITAVDNLIIGSGGNTNAEVIRARGAYPTLGSRLDASDEKIKDNTNNINTINSMKTNKTYVDSLINDLSEQIANIITEPAEGISEQEIIDARQGETSLGANLTKIKGMIETILGNKVTNGNFADNLNGFDIMDGSGSVTDNVARLISDGAVYSSFGAVLTQRLLENEIPQNEKWYTSARIRTLEEDATELRVGFRGSTGSQYTSIANPIQNEWYTLSYLFNENETLTGHFQTGALGVWPVNQNVGKTIEVENVIVVNLTESFGAGNEPSQETMDKLLSLFPGAWFDKKINVGDLSVANFNFMVQQEKDINEKLEIQNQNVEDAIKSDINNFIYNGDFHNKEDTGWEAESGTVLSIANNTMTILGNGENVIPRMRQVTNVPFTPNRKIYIQAKFTVTNSDCTEIGFGVFSDIVGETARYLVTSDFNVNEQKVFGGMVTMDEEGEGPVKIQVRTRYPTAEISNNKGVEVREVLALDLTDIFGEGNEPSEEVVKDMVSRFPSWFDQPVDLKTTQKVLFSYITQSSQTSLDLRKPILAITFDDGFKTDLDVAYPILRARGVRGTSYIIGSRPGTDPRYMTWEEIKQLKYDGWGIECHTYDHIRLADATDQEIHEQMQLNNQAFLANGLPTPRHHALPYGSGSLDSRVYNIIMQYRKTCRKIGSYSDPFNTYSGINFATLNAQTSDIRDNNVSLIETRKAQIDQLVEDRGIGIWFSHEMVEGAGDYESEPEYWTEIIDYALEKDVQFVTIEELYRAVLDYRLYTQS